MEEDSKAAAAACMNDKCRVSLGSGVDVCIQGWPLGGGSTRFAALCHFCGSAYQQLVFCDIFHSNDSGWRDCTSCTKPLHCGCIASSSMIQLLDSGGVSCISCSKTHPLSSNSTLNKDSGVSAPNNQSTPVTNQSNTYISDNMKIVQCGDDTNNVQQPRLLPSMAADEALESLPQAIVEEKLLPPAEFASPSLSFCNQSLYETTQTAKPYEYKEKMLAEDLHDSSFYTNLTISLSATSGNTHLQPAGCDQERSLGKNISSFPQGSTKSRYLLPKPLKSNVSAGLDTNSGTIPQLRVARPPVEGRIKNQLLPRYWPRITDQELQQISGDSNSTVVPLFEKVLSASDAGRIGRLVLPKACAEAYFPPISQPEGLPLRIQDIKGKEWLFQFRFWPNNNSRMYVLEGVTPCIQSMQLQAGDTVTFSRMDPEGKLVMGFRKASNTVFTPDNKYMTSTSKCTFSIEPFILPVTDSLHSINSHPDSLQLLKESRNIPLSALSKSFSDGDFGWHKSEMNGGKPLDGPPSSSLLVPEHKKNRNIGSKSKRLLIDSQDALELKLSWEELQNMLCPPPGVDSSTVIIEDHEFEEYDQPPVFRKSSIFTVRPSGEQEQWTQCDSCLKWRSLPADVVLPSKWTCEENTRAQSRPSCSAKDELSPQELENLLKMNMEFKRQKIAAVHKPAHIHESSDPGDLGNPALVGGDMSGVTTASAATTTKHPRHRPGCSCIVCIQPPSGKGKHKPACTCNVCMTVKRRFKTLMMRRKKRQSEREAEVAQRGNNIAWVPKEEAEVESFLPPLDSHRRKGVEFEFGSQSSTKQSEKPEEIGKGQLDLNCHPGLEKLQLSTSRVSMITLIQEASLPLETYLKQKGLTSLVSDQLASSGLHLLPQAMGENEELCAGDHNLSHRIPVQEEVKQELPETHQAGNDPS